MSNTYPITIGQKTFDLNPSFVNVKEWEKSNGSVTGFAVNLLVNNNQPTLEVWAKMIHTFMVGKPALSLAEREKYFLELQQEIYTSGVGELMAQMGPFVEALVTGPKKPQVVEDTPSE